jgi:anti-sigma regulatory factor (Ser/Thr protein kinase)
MLTITLPASLSNLEKFIVPVSNWLKSQGLSRQKIVRIELALEEALVNISRYAYPQGRGDIEVRCQLMDKNRYLIEIIDAGIFFDVCALPTPELKACVAEREVGGLGVYLMRNMADEITYRREKDKNILRLIFQATPDRNAGATPFNPGHRGIQR